MFLQDQIIYSVHFLDIGRTIGCRESELIPADARWQPARFQPGDRVATRVSLVASGAIVARSGTLGEIDAIVPSSRGDVLYQVAFGERFFHVPEHALQALRSISAVDPAPE